MEEKNIKMVEKRYYKAGTQWKLSEVVEENITKEYYLNIINSCKFFRNLGGYERLTSGYTYSGYIPTQLNSISPDKKEKIVRSFEFNKNTGSIYYDQKKKEYK
ncbi:MAG: hypothetical protein MSA15_20500 [Clostridium sp.]|nr:hypothetical protein [Clostridium sp.]